MMVNDIYECRGFNIKIDSRLANSLSPSLLPSPLLKPVNKPAKELVSAHAVGRAGCTNRLCRLKPRASRSKGDSNKLWYA